MEIWYNTVHDINSMRQGVLEKKRGVSYMGRHKADNEGIL